MRSFFVETPQHRYFAKVERGILAKTPYYIPDSAGKVFIVTTRDVWDLHGPVLQRAMLEREHHVLFFAGGEERKRLSSVEELADQMVTLGADRTSIVVAFGGGIVNDLGGFLASIYMRGIPVLQVPTTLLAQVDASIGGKTGVNLVSGKNLAGAFHQPLGVLIDPDVLRTLPEREYRAGLHEVIKCGVIRSEKLFDLLANRHEDVLARKPEVVEELISESVRIKAEVVSADEKEGNVRRILNFGHTYGHALEAETAYKQFLHGEAVAFGMVAAVHLALLVNCINPEVAYNIVSTIKKYGPIPSLAGITPESLVARLRSDKKTIKGRVHFVLPEKIGKTRISSDIDDQMVFSAVKAALAWA
jgi:3-dehydroquinate synthase